MACSIASKMTQVKSVEALSEADTRPSSSHSNASTRTAAEEIADIGGSICRLVVKGTFLDMAEGPGLRARGFRKAKTDSVLETPEVEDEDYRPGAFADAARSRSNSPCPEQQTTAESESSEAPGRLVVEGSSIDVPAEDRAEARPVSPPLAAAGKLQLQMLVPVMIPYHTMFLPCPAPQQHQQQAAMTIRQQPQQKEASEQRTTVMLRNVPNNYTRDMLHALLDEEGFSGQYDFLYLPMDFDRRANLGYAFANLVDEEAAAAFWEAFDGFNRWCLPTSKVCQVRWSGPLQGLMSHLERYRNSPVMHPSVPDEYRPMIFSAGVRQAFPPPTRSLKPPQEKH
mmetsp:Transcript_7672/g.12197  ORF Transcript_7672/g.12197 Transcript_7672/m.12197 type:complete len:340 (+) Transcript_7672:71-1090(+)